jgi:hypothetical protein
VYPLDKPAHPSQEVRGPYPAVQFLASLSSSARVRLRPELVRRVRHCVPVNAVPCTPHVRHRLELVLWVLVQDCRLPVRSVPAAVRVRLREDPASAMYRAV